MASLLFINYNLILKNDPLIIRITALGVFASFLNSIIILSYLGPFQDDSKPIRKDDWRRYFIIGYALLNITLNLFSLLYDPKPYKLAIVAVYFLIIFCLRCEEDEEHIDHKSKKSQFVLVHSTVTLIIMVTLLMLILVKKYKQKTLNKRLNGNESSYSRSK